MANISGRVLFDAARTAAPPGGMQGIGGVAVALQNIATTDCLAVKTAADGTFAFTSVPNGSYRLVEVYYLAAEPTPGDFAAALPAFLPDAAVPPISFAPNPPPGATDLDCTIPNTLLFDVADADISGLYFCNGPVKYIPITAITDVAATIDPHNLLTDAFYGTMGTFAAGTPANTGVAVEPWPANVPGFEYVLPQVYPGHAPDDGEYTVQNILNDDNSNRIGAWWRIADRTQGNETGRMMVVNGWTPGAVFYTEDVAVQPNTNYLFSAWIINLFRALGYADPALGVEILDSAGDIMYAATLGAQIPVNTAMPEWKQIGTVINSRASSRLTVRFLSEGPAAIGNDYAIDNLALQEIHFPVFAPRKTASQNPAEVGSTITYTITLTNTAQSPLTNVTFTDQIPDGFVFAAGSVTVNGVNMPSYDPAAGFSLPDIPGGGTATVTFDALAAHIPSVNPPVNTAEMTYNYSPVENGIPGLFEMASNPAPVRINPAWCGISALLFQRESHEQQRIAAGAMVTLDAPVIATGAVTYNYDGTVEITRRGTYFAVWFCAGAFGLATDGQAYVVKKYDADGGMWQDLGGAVSNFKVSPTAGFAVISVTDAEIAAHGKVAIALFNNADSTIDLTQFAPNAALMIYGADFACIDDRTIIIENNLAYMNSELAEIEDFVHLSDIAEFASLVPQLAGVGAAVISIGNNYNFWGIGALAAGAELDAGVAYYLLESSRYPPLTNYSGFATISTLWIESPGAAPVKQPIQLDATGIYLVPTQQLTLPAGTKLSFTQVLILAP